MHLPKCAEYYTAAYFALIVSQNSPSSVIYRHIGTTIITKPKFKNLTLKKEEFQSDTDIHSYDLVMGLLPCDATEAIISASCKAQKDFYIAMCGCVHFQGYDPFGYYTPHMYQEYVIQLAQQMLKEYDNGELEVDFLPDEYGIDYPILYNRKK